MPSIFTRIVNGEIPCHKIAENEHFLAFLDVMPLVEGHTLVVPKQEIDYLFDMPDTLLAEMIIFAKSIVPSLQKAIPCKRIGMAVIGLEVPHAHIHLVPMNGVEDINFTKPKLKLSQEALAEIAVRIKSNLQ